MIVEVTSWQVYQGYPESANVVVDVIQAPRKSGPLDPPYTVTLSPMHQIIGDSVFLPDLLNRHILDDILCVKQVVSSQNGMNAW